MKLLTFTDNFLHTNRAETYNYTIHIISAK